MCTSKSSNTTKLNLKKIFHLTLPLKFENIITLESCGSFVSATKLLCQLTCQIFHLHLSHWHQTHQEIGFIPKMACCYSVVNRFTENSKPNICDTGYYYYFILFLFFVKETRLFIDKMKRS